MRKLIILLVLASILFWQGYGSTLEAGTGCLKQACKCDKGTCCVKGTCKCADGACCAQGECKCGQVKGCRCAVEK